MQRETKGIVFCLLQALIWSLFPVLTVMAYRTVQPLFAVAAATSFAALFFAFVLTIQRGWGDLRNKEAYLYILGNTFLNAFLYFLLLFWGTSLTSPGNVAIVLRMETFFAIVLLGSSGYDKLSRRDVLGAFLMIFGAMVVLFPGTFSFNHGDLIILIAVIMPVFGNVCAKKARAHVSTSTIMFTRALLSAPFFWFMAFYNDAFPRQSLSFTTLFLLFVIGFVVMGLARLFWIEAIHRIPISKGNSISSICPLLTLGAAYFLMGEIPTIWQISAVIPMILGLNLLIRKKAT